MVETGLCLICFLLFFLFSYSSSFILTQDVDKMWGSLRGNVPWYLWVDRCSKTWMKAAEVKERRRKFRFPIHSTSKEFCSAARHRNAQSPYRVVSFQRGRRPLIFAKRASLSEQTLTNMFQCTRMAVSASPTPLFAFFLLFFLKKKGKMDTNWPDLLVLINWHLLQSKIALVSEREWPLTASNCTVLH